MSIDACQTLCMQDSQCIYFVYQKFTHFCQTLYAITTDSTHVIWIKINNNNIKQIPGQILATGANYGYNYANTTPGLQGLFLRSTIFQVAQYNANIIDSSSTLAGITFSYYNPTSRLTSVPEGYVTGFKMNF